MVTKQEDDRSVGEIAREIEDLSDGKKEALKRIVEENQLLEAKDENGSEEVVEFLGQKVNGRDYEALEEIAGQYDQEPEEFFGEEGDGEVEIEDEEVIRVEVEGVDRMPNVNGLEGLEGLSVQSENMILVR